MELTLSEINELIYCLSVAPKHDRLVNEALAEKVKAKLTKELYQRLIEVERISSEVKARPTM
ncbi:hypothetical protein UFOVP449_29 [uncultured Caudovirales phage]|uniref:Uncharacterized protein n=1 Tax=uncultured Caudovirales phage TaxID=2100421 RepID=A0A6J5M5K6_9CAUD|nr:hypothetical protein UFOVP449_29 [uncultured Caudovirales phage]